MPSRSRQPTHSPTSTSRAPLQTPATTAASARAHRARSQPAGGVLRRAGPASLTSPAGSSNAGSSPGLRARAGGNARAVWCAFGTEDPLQLLRDQGAVAVKRGPPHTHSLSQGLLYRSVGHSGSIGVLSSVSVTVGRAAQLPRSRAGRWICSGEGTASEPLGMRARARRASSRETSSSGTTPRFGSLRSKPPGGRGLGLPARVESCCHGERR
jgi:hypothetical protein